MKGNCTKGSMPKTHKPPLHRTQPHGSRKVDTSFNDKLGVSNNAGGKVTGDDRKHVASKTA